jgi:outer membrane protein
MRAVIVIVLTIAVTATQLSLSPRPAMAQQLLELPVPTSLPNFAGLAIGTVPDYVGSSNYIVGPAPFFRMGWGGQRNVLVAGNQLSANVVDHPWFRAGPAALVRLGRDDVKNKQVDEMRSISPTVELGAFAGVEFVNAEDPLIRFSSRLTFQHDVGQVNDGYVVRLSANYWHPIAEFLLGGLATSVSYGSGSYMNTYFGVSNSDARRSGLPTFNANGGVKDFWIGPYFLFSLSREWHLGVGGFYSRLLGDAADSPVVEDVGNPNQFIAGAGFLYSW